jgi:peptide methionine sulfoxide reductase msrA/msrB
MLLGHRALLQANRSVVATEVGYANGITENPTYQEVCAGQYAVCRNRSRDLRPKVASLEFLLNLYFMAIDPTSINRQGHDVGSQYRTGVYYTDEADLPVIDKVFAEQAAQGVGTYRRGGGAAQELLQGRGVPSGLSRQESQRLCHLPSSLFEYARKAKMKKE